MSRYRAWTWTLNNYTPAEVEHLLALGTDYEQKGIVYLCWAPEVGAEGTPHLQGYVSLKNAKTRTAALKLLGSRLHMEHSRGTPEENRLYCQKRDQKSVLAGKVPNAEFIQFGTIPQKGRRTDLEEVKELIEDGVPEIHILDMTKDRSIHCRYQCASIPKGTKKIFTTNETDGACCLIEDGAIKRRVDIHHLGIAFQ